MSEYSLSSVQSDKFMNYYELYGYKGLFMNNYCCDIDILNDD
jgi:hypothetical protein